MTVREIAPVYGGVDGVASRLAALIETLGNNRVADILGVSASQPSRWHAGHDNPSEPYRTSIIELDHVLARLFTEMMPQAGLIWLESFNQAINTRPVDALKLGRFDDVMGAIQVEEHGGFL